MEKTYLVNDVPEEVVDALAYSQQQQRFLFYTGKLEKGPFLTVNYAEDEEKVCYSEMLVNLKMGTKLYLGRKSKKGFTYNKQTKKIQVWFGSNIATMTNLACWLRAINKEWVVNENLTKWLTKTLLEKVLSGTITNPKQACKFIIQQNRLKVSPEKLRAYIKAGREKHSLLFIKDIVTNLNHYLDNSPYHSLHEDLIQQAKALGRQIDLSWSKNRVDQLHADWTNELMRMEMEDILDVKVEWPKLKLPANFELIDSKKRLFEEGAKMHHCIYTNYWNRVRDKRYMVLHAVDKKGNEATVGLNCNGTVKLDAVYAKYNKEPSIAIKAAVRKLLKDKEFIESTKLKPHNV